MSVNKVILIGHCGKNPQVKFSCSGAAVCKFSLATNETFKDKNGEQREHTEWHSIVCFGKLAERSGETLSRGKRVYLEGSIRSRKYEDREGIARKAYDIVARWMQILSPATNGNSTKSNNLPAAKSALTEKDDNPFRVDEPGAEDAPF
jgi:single-strand DNA-binding protein